MWNEAFADGVGGITVSGTTVRMDLVSLPPADAEAGDRAKPVFRQRIIMPVEGFANAVELMQEVLKGLVDAGAVVRQVPAEAVPLRPAEVRMAKSPNFS